MVTAPGAPASVKLGKDLTTLQVVINGNATPVLLKATDTAQNSGIADLAASLDAALCAAGIDNKVRATSFGGVLVIGSVAPSVTTLAVQGAGVLGFADNQLAPVNPAAAALGLGAGATVTASFRFNSIQAFIGALNDLIKTKTDGTPFDAHLVYLETPPSIQFNFSFKADFVRGTQLAFDRGIDIGLGTLNLSAAADASFQAAASFNATLGIDLNQVGTSDSTFTATKSLASLNSGQGVDVLAGLSATGDAPTDGLPINGNRTLSFDVLTIDASGAANAEDRHPVRPRLTSPRTRIPTTWPGT